MNEIEKMYENAQIEPVCDGIDCGTCTAKCNNGKYPEFTAEKQLELVKWLATINYDDRYFEWGMATDFYGGHFFDNFDECLADLVNVIWQDLTPEEKQQIKEVLEG